MPELLGSTTAGLQVPVMPFNDVLGNTGTGPLPQIVSDFGNENRGSVLGVTIMVIVVGKAQLPGVGVNV